MKHLVCLGLFALVLPVLADGDDPKDRTPVWIRGKQKAPEFADIESWLNSEPLAMEKLKGKVVVVHFLAFG